MKKTTMINLLALVLTLLVPFACAETSAAVQGVFDALTADGSDYNQTKAMYAEYFEGIQWEEAVEGDSIVISISNSEYMDGSWTFTQEGDYLTATFDGEDYTGLSMAMSMLKAVGGYLGMETDVLSGYVSGMNYLGIENDCFIMERDEAAGTTTVRINDAAPWDMAELDQMVLDETVVEPMEEGFTSSAANFGKLTMVANVEGDGMVILLGEYGGLDDLAYRSIINVVSILKPAGWEDFIANYTELADAAADGYTVTLNADMAEVSEIVYDAKDSYSYAIIRFGGLSASSESDVMLSDDASDFVQITDIVPDAILEIRYYSTYNFVGDRIDGYEEPLAFLTQEAAAALKEVSDELVAKGYRLKIFDAYRPQMAVTNFMNWALDPDDTRMKEYFYPELDKDVLFPQGYIAEHSGHSRGSTVDLTLFDMTTEKEVDMGGTFDYFGELSHPDYTDITEEQYANRMILREAMLAHGFKPLVEEWWHFTLEDEPYPDTYFTFPINSDSLVEVTYDYEPPAPAEAPSVDELAEGYFSVFSGLEPGTAGVSLKTAVAASKVCAFAEAHELYNPDVESLRANMLAAFEGMDEDGQAAFWTGFDAVRALLDDCLDDYDANRAIFEDAGVVEAMDEVMYDPLNRLAWENLRDHTLTLGNDMNVG